MSRLQRLSRGLTTSDAVLSMGERVAGWIVSGGIGGILTTVGGTVIGWIAGNILYGLVIGMGLGMLVLMGAAVKAIRVAAAGTETPSQTEPEADDSSLPFPLPRPLPSDWSSRRTLSNLSFRLVDLIAPGQVLNQTNVRDKTFYKCTIHGPAILIPRDTRFDGDNKFFNEPKSEHPQSMLYAMTPDLRRTWFSGTVASRDCVFRDCTFVDIGFMGYEPEISRLRGHVEGKGDVQID